MSSIFADLLTQETIREHSGFRAFRDGHKYFERGQVYGLLEDHNSIRAKVLGLYEYSVQLRLSGAELDHECTCPAGKQSFCKHTVAVGLTWLTESGAVPATPVEHARTMPSEAIKMYLALQDRSALIELIMDQAEQDEHLQERLLFKIAGSGSSQGADISAIHALIDTITDEGGVEGAVTDSYIERLNSMLSALSDLSNDGQTAAAYELTEYALDAIEKVLVTLEQRDERFDDILFHLQDLHLTVCRAASPEPKALAHRLFEWRLNPVWDLFHDVMATYADVLTEVGLSEYRALAEATWAEMPVLKPGDAPPARFGRRFRLSYVMESLARESEDIEDLVKIKQRDLSQPASFLSIAETYEEAGKHEVAVLWAERGLKEFPDRQDPDLKAFLVQAYQRQGGGREE